MTLHLCAPANGVFSLDIREKVSPRVEIEGYCFFEPPVEYRFCRDGAPICDWRPGDTEFHDLQRGQLSWWMERGTGFLYEDKPQQTDHVTFGLSPAGLTLETRGLIGNPSFLINLRPGTFPETTCSGGE